MAATTIADLYIPGACSAVMKAKLYDQNNYFAFGAAVFDDGETARQGGNTVTLRTRERAEAQKKLAAAEEEGLTLSDERAAPVPGVSAWALNGPLWFGNASWFRMQLIDALPETDEDASEQEDDVDLLVLDARRIDDIDFTGFEALSDVAEVAALRDVPFLVVVQEGRTMKAFQGGGFSELLGRSRFFDTIPLAIAAYPNLRANRPNQQAQPDVEDHVR